MQRSSIISSLAIISSFVLVGCSTGAGEIVPDDPEVQDVPMSFVAYVGRAGRSVATPNEITSADALAQVGGFGVFGFAQGKQKFEQFVLDYAVPNFFGNQQIWNGSQTEQPGHKGLEAPATEDWQYAPVKYYDNNPGALHSFFAYAPYDLAAEMVYVNPFPPQLVYSIDQNIDLLWSEPVMNIAKPDVTKKITFNFQHALSKTSFYVAPFIDFTHAGDSHPINDPSNIIPNGTTIRVRAIHINGVIPYTGLLNTATGKWTADKKGDYFNVPGAKGITWTGTSHVSGYKDAGTSKLIPVREANIEVIYDVITGEGDDNSHITNKAVSTHTFALEQGKAYRFYLDLGLTSVKFTAQIVDWSIDKEPEAELQFIDVVTCTQIPWVDVDGGSIDVGL